MLVAASTETQAVDTTASTTPRGAGRAGSPLPAETMARTGVACPTLTFLRHSDFGIVIAAVVMFCDRFSITI